MADLQVPLLDLKAQYRAIRAEVDAAIAGVLESQHFILGEPVRRLEEEVARYMGAGGAVGCASGSEALLLAYMALGIGPGDEVVCPTYTFFSTAGSVARLGATPVFADIDPATYNVTAESLERAMAGREAVRAVVPVHLYGQVADMPAIEALLADRGVALVEDAAQAVGAVGGDGRRVGSRPGPTCLSFFPSKNLGGYGDGGMVLAGDPDLLDRMTVLRSHGGRPKYHHAVVGLNSRLDALQAAVLRVKLRHLEDWHSRRAENASAYDDAFRSAGAESSDVPLRDGGLPLRTPSRPPEPARHVVNQYVIRVPERHRDALRAHLVERGIGTEVYYPVPLHLQKCFESLGHRSGDLPEAEAAARETLALPVYPELDKRQREYVAGAVLDFLRAR